MREGRGRRREAGKYGIHTAGCWIFLFFFVCVQFFLVSSCIISQPPHFLFVGSFVVYVVLLE